MSTYMYIISYIHIGFKYQNLVIRDGKMVWNAKGIFYKLCISVNMHVLRYILLKNICLDIFLLSYAFCYEQTSPLAVPRTASGTPAGSVCPFQSDFSYPSGWKNGLQRKRHNFYMSKKCNFII